MAKKKELKVRVEEEINRLLDADGEPPEGRMKLLQLGIKMCALNAKLEENEYGDFFNDDPESGPSARTAKGPKPNGGGGAGVET